MKLDGHYKMSKSAKIQMAPLKGIQKSIYRNMVIGSELSFKENGYHIFAYNKEKGNKEQV